MAITAGTVWEVRTTGQITNGGGFYNLVPGTSIDYSQQDAPQLALTDIATNVAGTTLTSATGGFTAAMQGNIVYLSGGGSTAGFYQIVGWTSTNVVTIDRSAGASKSGVSGNVGGAFLPSVTTIFFSSPHKATGDIIWVKSGSYTIYGSVIISAAAGTPLKILGYKTVRGDTPTLADRPVWNVTTIAVQFGNYNLVKNMSFTGNANVANLLIATATGITFHNCKFDNTNATNKTTITGGGSTFIQCEFSYSGAGGGTALSASGSILYACYIHDATTGATSFSGVMVHTVVANCTTGIVGSGTSDISIYGCVVYGCTTGMSHSGTPIRFQAVNNIISGNATGVSFTTECPLNVWDNNCWDNDTDVVNVTKGPNDITADPLMVDPANEDFRLQDSSPCFNAGMQLSSMVGLP